MKRVMWTSLAVVSLVACVGCGGDDDDDDNGGGSATVDTGLDESRQLASLTPAELTQFCNGLNAANVQANSNTSTKDVSCRAAAILAIATQAAVTGTMPADPELQAACTQAYNDCLTAPAETNTCGQPDATCTATVGEAETCYGATLNMATQSYSSLPSCSTLTGASAQQALGSLISVQTANECQTVGQKCPTYTTVLGTN